jgi:hypothetical protein
LKRGKVEAMSALINELGCKRNYDMLKGGRKMILGFQRRVMAYVEGNDKTIVLAGVCLLHCKVCSDGIGGWMWILSQVATARRGLR